jgi:hypothetical protein
MGTSRICISNRKQERFNHKTSNTHPNPPPLSLPLPQTLKPNSNYGHPREIDVIHIRHQNSLRSRRKERDSSEQSLEQINLSLKCVSILLPLPLSIWTGGVEEKPKQTHLSFFLGKMLMGWSSVAKFIASLKEGTILTCSPELKSSAYSHLLDLEPPTHGNQQDQDTREIVLLL